MRSRPRRRLFAVAASSVLILSTATAVSAQEAGPDFTAEQLNPTENIEGNKAPSSALAKTDPALLKRTDSAPTRVLIKLDYDAAASYTGTVDGLAATSPAVTGKDLTGTSTAERRYDAYARTQEAAAVSAIENAVPEAEIGQSLRVVYGGVAASIPADEVETVLEIPGVVAVQQDTLNKPLTDSSPEFIGAPTLYDDLDTTANAGAGIIYANLDTGVWPEHDTFEDLGNLPAPPPTAGGTPRRCDFGDNPLTPASDPFVCNDKLIGGRPFLATYLSNPARAAAEPFHTARDSNGHGTHTASTAAGNIVDEAVLFGVDRGPVQGIAPGAHLMTYKVCGIMGCFGSDSAAAVQQAILDGVDVINFSISGGTDPFSDPVELAFLDAYAAGVFVSASAGNDGPSAGTANHLSPWVTTVAASTQTRAFTSTLTVNGTSETAVFTGASIAGIGVPTLPIVLASAPPYSNALCTAAAPAGLFTGKIVACQRGPGRIQKSFNVLQGGAAGMVLYNTALADGLTDNHWVPTVHLPDGTDFLAFLAANAGATASFTAGVAQDGQGDVMAAFSSRGPAGLFLKPDVSAPGVQILAANTLFKESVTLGPPGETYQAIAGTSMSSPHNAGAAVLLRALHPDWTPGQVKSALMTTAVEDLLKEDLTTPADPFDLGSGRIDLNVASDAAITFDETATNFAALGNDPLNVVHLNLPSINAPTVPGSLTTTRVATNTLNRQVRYDVSTTAPGGSTISVSPSSFRIGAGASRELEITIETTELSGTFFGDITLTPTLNATVPLHLPVVFEARQGDVALTSECDPDSVPLDTTTTCVIEATNLTFGDAEVDLTTTVSGNLGILEAVGATKTGPRRAELHDVVLAGARPGVPSVDPGASPGGFIPLALFGVAPIPIGDEQIINFNVPAFLYNGVQFTSIGVDSNGYLIAGGGSAEDNNCCNLPGGPDPARPNNVLAPFWTDLDGTGAPGIFIAALTDGVNTWIVVEHQVNVFGTTSNRHFQVWIGINGVQDISFTYDPGSLPGDPFGQAFLVGAENSFGEGDMESVLPTEDLRVTSTDPTAAESVTYQVVVRGDSLGEGTVRTGMTASTVPGVTTVRTPLEVVPAS